MAKEKETKPEDAGAQLFTLMEGKGQEARREAVDVQQWITDQTASVMPQIRPNVKLAEIPNQTGPAALNYGLLILHHSNHPLFSKLTPEEQNALGDFADALPRIFKNNKEDQGIYGTFHARLNAAR